MSAFDERLGLISTMRSDGRKGMQYGKSAWSICIQSLKPASPSFKWNNKGRTTNTHTHDALHNLIPFVQFNPLSANFTKWSNTLRHFVSKLPTNCLSVFDHFAELALKGLKTHHICKIFIRRSGHLLNVLQTLNLRLLPKG